MCSISLVAAASQSLQSLMSLSLNGNALSGPLPSTCALVQDSMAALDMSVNYISGSIPSCYGQSSTLRKLHLDANDLEGPFPAFSENSIIMSITASNQVTHCHLHSHAQAPSCHSSTSIFAMSARILNLFVGQPSHCQRLCYISQLWTLRAAIRQHGRSWHLLVSKNDKGPCVQQNHHCVLRRCWSKLTARFYRLMLSLSHDIWLFLLSVS